MAAPFDSNSREAVPKKRSAPIKFLVPLIYAPVLPLIRIALRKNPVMRDRLFTAVLAEVISMMLRASELNSPSPHDHDHDHDDACSRNRKPAEMRRPNGTFRPENNRFSTS
ncbi:hypothetical protein SDJN02_08752 [Cucurbita argyrosperma subsp. argyrosperma]|nr:hypothetical protein SDJN02_08752 [Cucurbita argyrosperma subsp. argyrosperma]